MKIQMTSKMVGSQLDPRIMELAEKIAAVHGPTRITTEGSGIHINFPSPHVVELEGEREVLRPWPHGYLNAEKYLFLGRYANLKGTYNSDIMSGFCMKTQKALSVRRLLKMKPIDERLKISVEKKVLEVMAEKEEGLVEDEHGRKVPRAPGVVIPITELEENHPAITYLAYRGFTDLRRLQKQFELGFCEEEEPEDWENKRLSYRRFVNGFKDTPQGRLIFNARLDGSVIGWQARILDMVVGDQRYFWHPYLKIWTVMEARNEQGKWELLEQYQASPIGFKYSKYKTATGSKRNQMVMGLEAARSWNLEQGFDLSPMGIVVEGPLDAARFGPPAMPLLGKFLSDGQADILARNFRRILYVNDEDEQGRQALTKVRDKLGDKVLLKVSSPPPGFEDPGAMDEQSAQDFLEPFIKPAWDVKLI